MKWCGFKTFSVATLLPPCASPVVVLLHLQLVCILSLRTSRSWMVRSHCRGCMGVILIQSCQGAGRRGLGPNGTEAPSMASLALGAVVLERPLAVSGSLHDLCRGEAMGHRFRLALRTHGHISSLGPGMVARVPGTCSCDSAPSPSLSCWVFGP